MQVLRSENPLWVPGLTIRQRLSYAATLLGWFDAWRTLGFAILPLVVVTTGAVPIRADFGTFAAAFLATFGLQQLAMRVLSRGAYRPVLSIVFELVRMTANLRSTLTLFTRRRPGFVVTPKGRQGDGRRRVRVPAPLRALLVGCVLASAWFALTLMGRTPVVYREFGAVLAAFGWLLCNAFLVTLAIARIRALRFAPERRASVRFDTVLPAVLGDLEAEVRDVSMTGARVITGFAVDPGTETNLTMFADETPVTLQAVVRSAWREPTGGVRHGLEFLPGQHAARAHLALALFHRRLRPHLDVGPAPAAAVPAPELAPRVERRAAKAHGGLRVRPRSAAAAIVRATPLHVSTPPPRQRVARSMNAFSRTRAAPRGSLLASRSSSERSARNHVR
jgi:cellulose synthase (UDP-forming)